MRRVALVLDRRDNVAIALRDLRKGERVRVEVNGGVIEVTLLDDVPFGHKFAIREVREGEYIVKCGEVIGRATRLIKVGEHVHVHNVESVRFSPRT
ncbi:MAG: D-galactarate dehydratase [Thermoprotei archaeon]|nr:MAG: D-galactarate dehydratase [Thermoprotei archaeon]